MSPMNHRNMRNPYRETLQNSADWDCLKTPILRGILRTQNPLLEDIVHFRKSYICSNKLDVQETNFSFTQFNRIRNHFLGCRIKDGR